MKVGIVPLLQHVSLHLPGRLDLVHSAEHVLGFIAIRSGWVSRLEVKGLVFDRFGRFSFAKEPLAHIRSIQDFFLA